MFTGLPPFSNLPPMPNGTVGAPAMFAGVPLVNPLLNSAETNIKTIDEHIAQLESVSQWLNLNLQMVNSSLQQLQVQKQTLLALSQWQQCSQDMLKQMGIQTDPEAQPAEKASSEPKTEQMPAAFEEVAKMWWEGLQNQFAQLAQPVVKETAPAAKSTQKARPRKTKPKSL